MEEDWLSSIVLWDFYKQNICNKIHFAREEIAYTYIYSIFYIDFKGL